MRLMTYTAPSAAEAMQLVRDSLGDEAIIVSTQRDAEGGAMRVTAALEEAANEKDENGDAGSTENPAISPVDNSIRRILTRHGTPERLAGILAQKAAKAAAKVTNECNPAVPSTALTRALETVFTFNPIDPLKSTDKNGKSGKGGNEQPLILVGPPGGGKTIAAAKLAAECTLSGGAASVFSADTRRAGGIEQLEAFTRLLKTGLVTAKTPEDLGRAVVQRRPGRFAVIDTPGINPFDGNDMAYLSRLIDAAAAEPILVLAAGGDAQETADMAHVFAELGVRRIIVPRLDVSRRVGGTLAAAHAGRFSFAGVGISPRISDAISPLDAAALARLILARRNGTKNLDGIRQLDAAETLMPRQEAL